MGIITPKVRGEMEDLTKAGGANIDVWDKLEQQLKASEGGMKALSETGEGLVSTMKDNWTVAVAEFGEAFVGFSKDGLGNTISTMQKLREDGSIEKWASNSKIALHGLLLTFKSIWDWGGKVGTLFAKLRGIDVEDFSGAQATVEHFRKLAKIERDRVEAIKQQKTERLNIEKAMKAARIDTEKKVAAEQEKLREKQALADAKAADELGERKRKAAKELEEEIAKAREDIFKEEQAQKEIARRKAIEKEVADKKKAAQEAAALAEFLGTETKQERNQRKRDQRKRDRQAERDSKKFADLEKNANSKVPRKLSPDEKRFYEMMQARKNAEQAALDAAAAEARRALDIEQRDKDKVLNLENILATLIKANKNQAGDGEMLAGKMQKVDDGIAENVKLAGKSEGHLAKIQANTASTAGSIKGAISLS
jgi:hypothetical protein